MFKVNLRKIKSNHNNHGFTQKTGWCQRLPILNAPFVFEHYRKDDPERKYLVTTRVVYIETLEDCYTFKTRNTEYQLMIVEWPKS